MKLQQLTVQLGVHPRDGIAFLRQRAARRIGWAWSSHERGPSA